MRRLSVNHFLPRHEIFLVTFKKIKKDSDEQLRIPLTVKFNLNL